MTYVCVHFWTGYGTSPTDDFKIIGEGEELAEEFGLEATFVEHFVCLAEADTPDRAREIAVERLRVWRQRHDR